MLPNGKSRTSTAATIGGLGLTGLITWATLRLKPIVSRKIDYEGIQFHGIDEFLDLTNQSKDIEYTVSWIDCGLNGRNFARGIFMQGDHSGRRDTLKSSAKPKLVFPFDAPGFALNHLSVSLFNTAYFYKQIHKRVVSLQDYEPFFYPLDKVLHWNRMYGKRGFLQFPVRPSPGSMPKKARSLSCTKSPTPASPASLRFLKSSVTFPSPGT